MRTILTILGLPLALAGLALASGTAGYVDTAFGTDGVAVLDGEGSLFSVAAQADGKILTAGVGASGTVIDGTETNEWQIRRLLADGSADTSFGTGGLARFFGDTAGTTDQPRALHVEASGRIWVAGRGRVQTGTSGKGKKKRPTYDAGAYVLRLEADGDLDTTFGIDGRTWLGTDLSQVQALVALDDGDVLVVGRGSVTSSSGSQGPGKGKKGGGSGSSSQGVVVARLDPDGGLDTAYGDAGFARVDLDTSSNDDYPTLHGAALQSDDSLVVMTTVTGFSSTGPRVGLIRLTAAGARDGTFADPLPDVHLRSMAVDAQDRIVAAGMLLGDIEILRYDADGTLDSGFGVNGAVTFDTSVQAYQTEPLGGHAVHFDGTDIVVACIEWVDEDSPIDGFHGFAIKVDDLGGAITSWGPTGDGQSERLLTLVARDAVRLPGGDLLFGGDSYASATLGQQAVGRLCGP